jgi:hypothetical protein
MRDVGYWAFYLSKNQCFIETVDKVSSGAVGVTENLCDKISVSFTIPSLETFSRAYFAYHSNNSKYPVMKIINPRMNLVELRI